MRRSDVSRGNDMQVGNPQGLYERYDKTHDVEPCSPLLLSHARRELAVILPG